MNITKEFEARGSRDEVFNLFQDIPTVAQCLPGGQLTGGEGTGPFQGTVSVAVGPVSALFEGEASIASDAAAYSGRIDGRGTDARGGNRGEIVLEYRLAPVGPDRTRVALDVAVDLSGPIARFGRTGLMNEIADQLIGEFSACLDAKLSATTAGEAAEVSAPEIKGIRLFFTGLLRWVTSTLRRLFGGGDA